MSQLESNTPTVPIESKEMSKEDVFTFLGEDGDKEAQTPPEETEEDKEPVKKPAKKEKTEEEIEDDEQKEEDDEVEEDELKDLEEELEELEEPSKEKLEVVAPVRRREILKKYPTLFKDFPYLEKAYYREQQFTQVYPTIDDAKDAKDKAETLARFEEDIVGNGNQKNILKLIKENNPKGFAKLVDDYMDNLAEIDEPAYHHIIGNLTKHTIKSMWDEGKASGNTKMLEACVMLNQYIFGSSIYKPPTKLFKEEAEDKAKAEINTREKELIKQAYEGASGDVSTRVNNYFKTNVEANIDPKKNMSDYVRRNATRDAIDKINDLIERDSRFKGLVDRLWEQSAKENFSRSSVDKIAKAFIARGKGLLAPVVRSARNEALRGSGKRVKEDPIEEQDEIKGEKPQQERSRSSKKPEAKGIPKGMSTLEALNSMLD